MRLRPYAILVLVKLLALGLISQHDADHQQLFRQLEGRFQRGVTLSGILYHVQHKTQIDNFRGFAWCVGPKYRVPARRAYVHAFEHAQVVAPTAAVVEERIAPIQKAEPQQMLHGRRETRPAQRGALYSTAFLEGLAAVRTRFGTALPVRARAEVERLRLVQSQIAVLDADKTQLVKAGRNGVGMGVDAMMARLVRLRGIGNNDAVLLATEVFCRDFRNRRELGGWSSLASVPWSSRCVDHDQGISKAGPSHVRKHLIQMTLRWLQYQPGSELSQWYWSRIGTDRPANRRLRKRLAVALARKLLIALWRYATLERVPAGAILH